MYSCNHIVKTTAIETAGTTLELVIPNMQLRHGQHIRICFAQTPPIISSPPYKVEVAVNGDKITIVQDRMIGGNGAISFLYSDQLLRDCAGNIKSRQFIDLIYAADTETFIYVGPCRCLPRANIEFPRNPAPTPLNAHTIKEK